MRSYETIIMELLPGNTPRQKYLFLVFLLEDSLMRKQASMVSASLEDRETELCEKVNKEWNSFRE
jgi:hypothetical protein